MRQPVSCLLLWGVLSANAVFADNCAQELGEGYSWDENRQTCVHSFERRCETLKKREGQLRYRKRAHSLSVIEHFLDSVDCRGGFHSLSKREHLKIRNSDFENVELLQNLPNLEVLDLSQTGVTDRSLRKLTGLPRLRIIFLTQTRVRRATSIRALLVQIPTLEAIHFVQALDRDELVRMGRP